MIVELAMVAYISQPNIELAKGSSGRSSGSSSRSTPKSAPAPKPTEQPKKQDPPKQNNISATTPNTGQQNKTNVNTNHSGKLDNKNQFKNREGKSVVYRDSGTNWFSTWFLFGWIWYNADANDKCYDAQHKPITCEKKKS